MMSSLRGLLRTTWRWSWIVTLPITVIFVHLAIATGERFLAFGVRYDTAPRKISITELAGDEWFYTERRIRLAIRAAFVKEAPSGLRTINLFVPEPALNELNARLPHSGFDYKRAVMLDADKVRSVKVRYRGDFYQHWGKHKRSFRVKTSKSELFDGMRTFNLVVPKRREMLNNFLAYRLADLMGLPTPRVELVESTLNGKRHGVYLMVEQLDEGSVRNAGFMPGDLYVGEIIARDVYRGIDSQLFDDVGLWDKGSVNNHYDPESKAPLEALISVLRAPDDDAKHQRLEQLVDVEAFARFSAFLVLCQSYHFDNTHNWRLLYDPARSAFHPFVWDPVGWTPLFLPRRGQEAGFDIIRTKLDEALHRNGAFLRARQATIQKFFEEGLQDTLLAEADRAIGALRIAVPRDPGSILKDQVIVDAMDELRVTIDQIFRQIRYEYLERANPASVVVAEDSSSVEVAFEGRRPVEETTLVYTRPFVVTPKVTLRYHRRGSAIDVDVSGVSSVNGSTLRIAAPISPRFETVNLGRRGPLIDRQGLSPATAYYQVLVEGFGEGNRLLEVRLDRGYGAESATRAREVTPRAWNQTWSVTPRAPSPVPEIWRGDVVIEGIREVDDALVIEPGTTIRMAKDALLRIRGRLFAIGSEARPIRFIPQDLDAPFGAVAILGPGADGSRLTHCEFRGGSGAKGPLFEYSAMLSIHDVQDITIERSHFEDSRVVDDMVHALHSTLRFERCEFVRALSDAVDLDISEAVIDRCTFRESGNDGLDLMTTRALVTRSTFTGNGDKGISVGENSRLVALHSRFDHCEIGVQVKDGSIAVLENVELEQNNKPLDAYRKNWRYGAGGSVFLYNARVVNNKEPITADKKSGMWIFDSYIDTLTGGSQVLDPRRIHLDPSTDANDQPKATYPRPWRFDEDRALMGDLFEGERGAASPALRGTQRHVP